MHIYTIESALKELEDLKNKSKQYITLIIKLQEYAELKKFIESNFLNSYPDMQESSLTAKIFVLKNPHSPIVCPYTKKKKKYSYAKNGYVCPRSCQCTKELVSETNFKRFGVTHPSKLESKKEQKKQTFLKNWGVDNPSKVPKIQLKKIQTNLKHWGCEQSLSSKIVQEKGKKTNLERRGCEYAMQDINVQQKSKNTFLEKTGSNCYWRTFLSDDAKFILLDKNRFQEALSTTSVLELSKKLNVAYSTILKTHNCFGLNLIKTTNSSYETEFSSFLSEHNIVHTRKDRKQIKPKELDFYFPNHNTALEFQGDYWHMNPAIYEASDVNASNKLTAFEIWQRDSVKYNLCVKNNIPLIVIWESDWIARKDEIKKDMLSYFS